MPGIANLISIIITAGLAVLPNIYPDLTPHGQHIATASIAGLGALFHLYQPPPVE